MPDTGVERLFIFHAKDHGSESKLFAMAVLTQAPMSLMSDGKDPMSLGLEMDDELCSKFQTALDIVGVEYYWEIL